MRSAPDGRVADAVAHTSALSALARAGLAVRGLTYVLISWLTLQIALGHASEEASQSGALALVARQRAGTALLWCLGIGFTGYALWRLTEAVLGTAAEGRKAGPRVQSLVRAIVYAFFAVSTFAYVTGDGLRSQSREQAGMTARLLGSTSGRWFVAVAGVVVVAVGVAMVVEGVRRTFEKQLRMAEMSGRVRTVVVRLGTVGTTARGIVFAVTGGFVVAAAIREQPSKSRGLDGALRSLADTSAGPWLLGFAAAGLLAFGCYGIAMARYAKTEPR